MSEFRGAHDFRAGDRVLVVDDADCTDAMRVGEIRTVHSVDGFVRLVGSNYRMHRERFLRIVEPGEVVPRGAVTRSIVSAMKGNESSDWHHGGRGPIKLLDPRVVISVPPVESERERKLRELGEQIEKLQAKYDELAGVGE